MAHELSVWLFAHRVGTLQQVGVALLPKGTSDESAVV